MATMLTESRFHELTDAFRHLSIALVGDFCLDRYLEIDFHRQEVSLETGLPVWNVAEVRPQPGGCGTIANNLVALGASQIHAVGFCGWDGEGWELRDRLGRLPGVNLDHFQSTHQRKTFTYTKPLALNAVGPPTELNRIDIKNWDPTPVKISEAICRSLQELAVRPVNAVIVLDQCDKPNVGAVTDAVLATIGELAVARMEERRAQREQHRRNAKHTGENPKAPIAETMPAVTVPESP